MIIAVMLWCLFAGASAATIVQDPPVLYTPVGQSAVMSCEMREAENLQILYYHWHLDYTSSDHVLKNSTRFTIIFNTLIISSVTTDDTGIYICTARDYNLHVYNGTGTHLLVQGISAVTIVQDPPVLYIPVGERAVMSCEMREAENAQNISYHWYLNDTHPDRILRNSPRVTIMSNTLNISSVTTDDNGIYICTARNYKLHVYQGTGTHFQVQDSDPQEDHYKYLYGLFLLIPLLLILVIYWIFRLPATNGAQERGTKKRDKRSLQKKDDETELHYSTIFPKEKGAKMKKEIKTSKRTEEAVEYAPVKIAVSSLSLPYTCETCSTDNSNVLYATLKTENS